jgi:Effector-associated domain 5
LTEDWISRLHGALVECGVAGSIDVLLSGVDRSLTSDLPVDPRPNVRLLSVLRELNERGRASDGSIPFETFLKNAAILTQSRPESHVFLRALEVLSSPVYAPPHGSGVGHSFAPEPPRRSARAVVPLVILLLLVLVTLAGVQFVQARSAQEPAVASSAAVEAPVSSGTASPETATPPAPSAPAPDPQATSRPIARLPAKPATGDGLDRKVAAVALGRPTRLAKQQCYSSTGPTGTVNVAVTFGPDGKVRSASAANPAFAGTPVGRCIERLFMTAQVPPYDGSSAVVSTSFALP